MKKIIFIAFLATVFVQAKAQVAMDFIMNDCNNNMHHLYADYLDNEEVVIIEFFMVCSSCIDAGQAISVMYDQLALDYPGQVHFFAFNFNDDFDCSVATGFVNDFAINAIPFDSGAAQLAYYGGFGMPTVVIAAGSQHEILYSDKTSVAPSDTSVMDSTIRSFFTHLGLSNEAESKVLVYPNPTNDFINIQRDASLNNKQLLRITNLVGEVIVERNIYLNKETENVDMLAPGIYIMEIIGKDGIVSQKIIKQ